MMIEERIDMLWKKIGEMEEKLKELDALKKRFPESKFHWENYTDKALMEMIDVGRKMTADCFKGSHVEAFGLEIIGACNYVLGKRAEEKEDDKDPDGTSDASCDGGT